MVSNTNDLILKALGTDEEILQLAWKKSPDLRKEFVEFATFKSYCQGLQAGAVKRYGGGSTRVHLVN